MDAPDILKKILAHKLEEVARRREARPLEECRAQASDAPPPRGFARALATRIARGEPAVIAEIKRASPSKGLLREAFDPAALAASYQRGGATCLSVLTDRRFFQGSEAHLRDARAACHLPILRKDFIVDPYQIYEARLLGADAILLIVAALEETSLREWNDLAHDLGLDTLVEVHDEGELDRALALPRALIGINNRDLRTFRVRLDTTRRLAERVPAERLLVSESGIHSPEDVATLRGWGIGAFLVGEAFMRAPDPGAELRRLFGGFRSGAVERTG